MSDVPTQAELLVTVKGELKSKGRVYQKFVPVYAKWPGMDVGKHPADEDEVTIISLAENKVTYTLDFGRFKVRYDLSSAANVLPEDRGGSCP